MMQKGALEGLRFKVPPEAQLCTLLALTGVQAQNGCDQAVLPLQHILHCRILFSFALDEIKIMLNRHGLWSLFSANWGSVLVPASCNWGEFLYFFKPQSLRV